MAPLYDMLILAVTRMRVGVCVAGMVGAPDSPTRLRWVRPVKARGQLLPGDIRYPDGALMRLGDVVNWRLGPPRPEPPHVEDVLVDPVRERATLQRRLDPGRRARFCATHLDTAPEDVLVNETRSLCLLRPAALRATWSHDPYSGHYEARVAFQAGRFATDERGIPATDLAWRALGREWLAGHARLELDDTALRERIGDIYLAIGRGRAFEGRRWLLVVGIHAAGIPEVTIDESSLS
jgi:hypothetical protein